MTQPVITIENLSKEYIIGQRDSPYTTFREAVLEIAAAPFKRLQRLRGKVSEEQRFLALENINLQINEGEVVGIIGRNGAGKTTLLKILSRITQPTGGRVIIKGRVSSLLDVGTGFHPELTGRENIYLNAAILGMTRKETDQKFDEIVEFSEVEKFLDTPVKRYSSGMQVRLAFSVAAHLEPELLIIDEVLAVGDIAFQKKCLGKMGDISLKNGRTVLFVSHNMQAVKSLCSRAILLDKGTVKEDGPADTVTNNYMASTAEDKYEILWDENNAPGDDDVKLFAIRLLPNSEKENRFSSKSPIVLEMEFTVNEIDQLMSVGFDLSNAEGAVIFRSYQTDMAAPSRPKLYKGRNIWRCTLPGNLFNVGTYFIAPRIGIDKRYWIVHEEPVIKFEISLDHGVSEFWDTLVKGSRPGCIAPILNWEQATQKQQY